jgi:hypothetical protein
LLNVFAACFSPSAHGRHQQSCHSFSHILSLLGQQSLDQLVVLNKGTLKRLAVMNNDYLNSVVIIQFESTPLLMMHRNENRLERGEKSK